MRLRTLVATYLALAAGIFCFAAARGLTRSPWGAALIAALAAGGAGLGALRSRRLPLDPAACSRGLKIASAVAAGLALVVIGRLTVFMIDPAKTAYSFIPSSNWELQHSCLTAYYVAADAVRHTPKIYDNALYSAPDDDPAQPRKPLMLGAFQIDVYEYPPPFLLLPRALLALTPAFSDLRMLWFGLNGIVMLGAMLLVASALDPAAGTRALLLSPIVWLAPPTISTLQKGNVQGIVVAISMIAMLLFARRRFAAGGALLAFATASKLYPGLLIVYLIVRRDWRAVAWTAACGVAIGLATLAAFGWAPYATFLQHMPGLMSGEAFPAFRRPTAMAINLSIPGLVFKAKLFGIPGMGFPAAKLVGWLYTAVALAAVAWVGLRKPRPEREPLVWLAILTLATLRSPFLPQSYGAMPPLWLLTLVGAVWGSGGRAITGVVAIAAALSIYWPHDWPADPRWIALLTCVTQAAIVALIGFTIARCCFRKL